MIKRFFPRTYNIAKNTDGKVILGSISLGCIVASLGIIGVYIDQQNSEFSAVVWGLLVVIVGAIALIINQAGWAKDIFRDYCDWRKKFHVICISLPFLILSVWGLKLIIPKFLKNYCGIPKLEK